MNQKLTYELTEPEPGEWFFAIDGSEPVGPYPNREEAEEAIQDALSASLADALSQSLFGEAA